MPSYTQQQMLDEIARFTGKLVGVYRTGSIPANGTVVLDAPTLLGFTAATHEVYSTSIELRMVDPFTGSNPPVVEATAVLTFAIAADGKITLYNNHSAAVTYHVRLRSPVKKQV